MDKSIVRHISPEGIEFFTDWKTGVSGLSKSGVALMCGVSKVSITKLFQKIEKACKPEDLSRSLKSLYGKSLSLLTETGKSDRNYTNVDVVPDVVCIAVIHYYALDTPNPIEKAKDSLLMFSVIGLRAYIHAQTGWSSEMRNVRAYLTGLIVDEPKRWDEHFDTEWRSHAERVTGWKWSDRVMGKFLNEAIYSYFPQSLRDELNRFNPLDVNGRRPNKQHQHFDDPADEILREHIKTVGILLQASSSLEEFRLLMQGKFQGCYQLKLKLD